MSQLATSTTERPAGTPARRGVPGITGWRRTVLLALPRVALAVLLGVVIATPLTLKIFGSEVDR